jgi:hypothetical protein
MVNKVKEERPKRDKGWGSKDISIRRIEERL